MSYFTFLRRWSKIPKLYQETFGRENILNIQYVIVIWLADPEIDISAVS